jgi:hypothetical protein
MTQSLNTGGNKERKDEHDPQSRSADQNPAPTFSDAIPHPLEHPEGDPTAPLEWLKP